MGWTKETGRPESSSDRFCRVSLDSRLCCVLYAGVLCSVGSTPAPESGRHGLKCVRPATQHVGLM